MAPSTEPTPRAAALRLLGLPESATGPQIVHAYRRLVRATHPDATGRTDAATAQQFAAIHDAYQLLTQPAGHEDAGERAGPVEPSANGQPGEGTLEVRTPVPRPPRAIRTYPARPPIVAGPVVVAPLPEQHRPNPRRPR